MWRLKKRHHNIFQIITKLLHFINFLLLFSCGVVIIIKTHEIFAEGESLQMSQ